MVQKILLLITITISMLVPQIATANVNNTQPNQLNIPNASNSEIINNIEQVRSSQSGKSFEDFMQKLQEFSLPVSFTMIVIAGVLFVIGFAINIFKKVAGFIILGVILGFPLINYGDRILGAIFAIWDYVFGFFLQ